MFKSVCKIVVKCFKVVRLVYDRSYVRGNTSYDRNGTGNGNTLYTSYDGNGTGNGNILYNGNGHVPHAACFGIAD